jgi:hypothetical protein
LERQRPWLTPKSDSFESFFDFASSRALVIVVCVAMLYVAITERHTLIGAAALFALASRLLPRR